MRRISTSSMCLVSRTQKETVNVTETTTQPKCRKQPEDTNSSSRQASVGPLTIYTSSFQNLLNHVKGLHTSTLKINQKLRHVQIIKVPKSVYEYINTSSIWNANSCFLIFRFLCNRFGIYLCFRRLFFFIRAFSVSFDF